MSVTINVEERREQVVPARQEQTNAAVGCAVQLSELAVDPTWDAFVAATPDSRHVQTSWWAQTKVWLGWRAGRVLIRRDGRIVAGAQLLSRRLGRLGAAGYVARGPLGVGGDPELQRLALDGIDRLLRAHRIRYLVVQPPPEASGIVEGLRRRGFRPAFADLEPNPSDTIVVDLTKSLEELLGGMKEKTRYNIRLAQRKGITAREGSEADLEPCHRLLACTSQRQDFPVPTLEYFRSMWRLLHPRGYLRMFLTEYEGEVVTSLLAIAFGDTVTFKFGGWSGRHGNRHPNELMHWTAMRWAKAAGYRSYDFESFDPDLARAIVRGEPLPDPHARTVATFKLGFGGQVRCLPGAYERVTNPALRMMYNPVSTLVMSSPRTRAAVKRVGKLLRAR